MLSIPGAISNALSSNTVVAQKASPEVLLVAGIAGMIGGTVLACRATLKMHDILDTAKSDLEVAKKLDHEDYSEQDRSRDISLIYFQSSVKTVKVYAPAVIVTGLSIAALMSSHRILSNRNLALTAAYSALDQGFRQYRARVVDKYGEDEDRELRYGTERVQIVDEETKRKKTVTRVGTDLPSIYSRFFDEGCGPWSKDPSVNRYFLLAQQSYWCDVLKSRGHVFLNEVYLSLDLPHSTEGAVVGWVMGAGGDDYVDFGIFDGGTQRIRDFWNGREGAILLDFNVDGTIYDKI